MHNRRAKKKLNLALDESGAAAIFIALVFAGLCGFMGLAFDIGHMVLVKAELQRAADAGALSGVLNVAPYTGSYPDLTPNWLNGQIFAAKIVDDINNQADHQKSSITSSDVLAGYWLLNPQGVAQTLSPSRPLNSYIPAPAIRVTLTRAVTLSLAPIVGINPVQNVTAAATAILPEGNAITGAFAMAVNFYNVFDGTPESPGAIKTISQSVGYDLNNAQFYNRDGSNSVTGIRRDDQLKPNDTIYLPPGAMDTLYSLIQVGQTMMVPVIVPPSITTPIQTKIWYPIYAFVPFTVASINATAKTITGSFVNKVIDPGAVQTLTGGNYSGISGTPKSIDP